MRAIHQFVAGYAQGDAISNEARALRALFRSWGAASEIYCEARRIQPDLRQEVRDLDRAAREIRPEDVAVLHLSMGSPANLLFAELPARKALLYHNITPPEYFRGVREETARNLAAGREHLRRLAGVARVNLADSRFNAGELEASGYPSCDVFPLVFDYGAWGARPKSHASPERRGPTTVLFVGRGAPNKRIEDLVAAHYYLRRYLDPDARLVHVGSYAGTERYRTLIEARVRELRIGGVELAGAVTQDALNRAYRDADLFLCLSEHEGFCVPLMEAMFHGVPVMAFAAAAVPETLDGAGVLIREKRFDLISEMTHRLARDPGLRRAVRAGQEARLERYRRRDPAAELRGHLAPVLD